MISKGKYELELKSMKQKSDERILEIKSMSEKDIDDLKIQILKQKNTIAHCSDVENELRTELAKAFQEKNKRDALIEELLVYCKRLKNVRDNISGGVATFWKIAHACQSHMVSELHECKNTLFSLEEGYKKVNLSVNAFNVVCFVCALFCV